MNEVYVIRKRGKFLFGHSYATGVGDRYRWTSTAGDCRWFENYELAVAMARHCGGKVWLYNKTTKQATVVIDPEE